MIIGIRIFMTCIIIGVVSFLGACSKKYDKTKVSCLLWTIYSGAVFGGIVSLLYVVWTT